MWLFFEVNLKHGKTAACLHQVIFLWPHNINQVGARNQLKHPHRLNCSTEIIAATESSPLGVCLSTVCSDKNISSTSWAWSREVDLRSLTVFTNGEVTSCRKFWVFDSHWVNDSCTESVKEIQKVSSLSLIGHSKNGWSLLQRNFKLDEGLSL